MPESGAPSSIRAAELVASMCLATDLGMAFPFEHGLDATVAAIRLADSLGVDSTTMAETYYACLLMYAGCTTDLPAFSPLFPGGGTANVVPVQFGTPREAIGGVLRAMAPPEARPWGRAWGIARRIPRVLRFQQPHFTAICEVAEMLAAELGMPPSVHRLFRLITERWDGKSILKRAAGDEVPLPVRILHVARDATFNRLSYDLPEVVDLIRTRSGGAFDPTVAGRFVAEAGDLLHLEGISSWDLVMALEPKPHLMLEGRRSIALWPPSVTSRISFRHSCRPTPTVPLASPPRPPGSGAFLPATGGRAEEPD